MNTTKKPVGRGWAYFGSFLGGAVSIAANVAHSYVPPAAAPADWTPQPGAVAGAIFWPLGLFVAIEILARYAWPTGRRWLLLRYLGMVPVAVVAAVVSYRHLSGLLAFYREDALTVAIGPLAVDGLMVMATGALIAAGTRRIIEPLPVVEPTPVSANTDEPPPAEETSPAPEPEAKAPTRTPKRQPSAAERVAAAIARSPKASDAQIAARLKLSEKTVQRHRRQAVDSVSTGTRPNLKAV